MTTETEALGWYRKLVSRIYREIGAMERRNHTELYDKLKIYPGIPRTARIEHARRLYEESKSDDDLGAIEGRYEEWVGLTLQEVLRAFKEGNWQVPGIPETDEEFEFGGPKWAVIVEITLDLRQAVVQNNWERASAVVDKVKGLRHNTGLLVKQLKELDL